MTFDLIRSRPALVVCVALAIACLSLWLWGRARHAAADRWEAKALAERDNHRATKANVRAAQEAAAVASRKARLATEAQFRQLAERADHAEQDLAAARAAADRFADARRVQVGAGGAAGGTPGNPGASGQDRPPEDRDGPGADAVVLTRSEFDQLAGNTLRLEQVRRWGQSLIDAGMAEGQGL